MEPIKTDVLIVGGGLSGWMVHKRIQTDFPELTIKVIDKSKSAMEQNHPFHLHRPIHELTFLNGIKKAILKTNVWDGNSFKAPQQVTCNDIIEYSRKVFGSIQVTNINNVADIEIYPANIELIRNNITNNHHYISGVNVRGIDLKRKEVTIDGAVQNCTIVYRYVINTIPLYSFLDLSRIKHNIDFEYFPFYSCAAALNGETNLYQMIYNTDRECGITRTTLLSDKLYIESKLDHFLHGDYLYLKELYGIDIMEQSLRLLVPGRITPLSADVRKPLLHYLTEKYDAFCLGRYGAWSFKVANDVWDDTRFISSIIYAKEQSRKYERRNSE